MAREPELKAFLMRTPFFGGLEDVQLDRVLRRLRPRAIARSEGVFREGEQGRSMYVVTAGELLGFREGPSGRAVKMVRFRPGDFFGEMTLIEMQPRSMTVRAEAAAALLELDNMDLFALYKEDPLAYVLIIQNVNRELCRRLRRADARIAEYADDARDPTTQIGLRAPGLR